MAFKPCGNEVGDRLTEQQVLANIADAFASLSGEEIAEVANKVCFEKIEYTGDNVWTVTGHDD